MKISEEERKKQNKTLQWSWICTINTMKMVIVLKSIYRFNKTLITIRCFVEKKKKIPKFIQKPRRPPIARTILRKRSFLEGQRTRLHAALHSCSDTISMGLAHRQTSPSVD